jgi:hypothetical protein
VPDPRDSLELSFTPLPTAARAAGASPDRSSEPQPDTDPAGRPWLGIFFRCANLYTRAYRSADASGYLARCPRCGKTMTFTVGPGGTARRRFELSC